MGDVAPVRVVVRARPLSEKEIGDCAQQALQYFVEAGQIVATNRPFTFDSVFDPSANQEAVFEICAAPLLEHLFKGYNCTVIAYGQTGSGKTYTMGTEADTQLVQSEQRGIVPRIVDKIFEGIASSDESAAFSVRVSMLEIYDEKVFDLLTPTKSDPLMIREQQGSVFVQGLTGETVENLTTTMRALERGCSLRAKGETAMNDVSSRSHAIFTICLEKITSVEGELSFKAKLHLVDLAGSERLKKTQAEGDRMKEGIRINEGLLALGNVISALSEGARHVPYRDSKITRILQDSLGGSSYTVMIACVSPADSNAEETLNTLRYADRAKKIKNKPSINADPAAIEIQRLREEVLMLRKENLAFKTGGAILSTEADGETMASLRVKLHEAQKKIEALDNQAKKDAKAQADLGAKVVTLREGCAKLQAQLERVRDAVQMPILGGDTEGEEQLPDMALRRRLQSVLDEQAEDMLQASSTASIDDDDDPDATVALAYALYQSKAEAELDMMERQIVEKEKLVKATMHNEKQTEALRVATEKQIAELRKKIEEVEKEKKTLTEKLRSLGNSSKVAEERRKKLQELEKQLADDKKRLKDMERLEKLNTEKTASIVQLSKEILDLKQMKVKMMKQQRAETAKYQEWKAKMERQVAQMRSQEKKKEGEQSRQNRTLTQQLVVMRRKYEEATLVNKRLQQQIQRVSTTRDGVEGRGFVESTRKQIEDGLMLVSELEGARLSCDTLLQQRTELSKEQKKIHRKLRLLMARRDGQVVKSSSLDAISGNTTEDESKTIDELIEDTKKELERIEAEIGLLSGEFQDMMNNRSSVDLEAQSESWVSVNTVTHARAAIKILVEMAIQERRVLTQKERLLIEMRGQKEELEKELTLENQNLRTDLQKQKRALSKYEQELLCEKRRVEETLSAYLQACDGIQGQLSDKAVEQLAMLRRHAELLEDLGKRAHNESSFARLKRTTSESSMSVARDLRRSDRHRNAPTRFGEFRPTDEVVPMEADEGNVTASDDVKDLTFVDEASSSSDIHKNLKRKTSSITKRGPSPKRATEGVKADAKDEKENELNKTFSLRVRSASPSKSLLDPDTPSRRPRPNLGDVS